MLEDLDRSISTLRNQSAGWATRKEIAHTLGEIARRALHALRELKDDQDHDVRNAVRSVLRQLPSVDAAPEGAPHDFALEELAQHCAKPGSRTVFADGDGYRIVVRIGEGRSQSVYIQPAQKDDGSRLLRVYSPCGKPDASSAAWALRSNATLIGCAFAVENFDRFEHLIIVENFERDRVSPAEILVAVKQVAFYGDWLEQRLSDEDVL